MDEETALKAAAADRRREFDSLNFRQYLPDGQDAHPTRYAIDSLSFRLPPDAEK